jgi:PAS domain-containing protein
MALFQLLRSAFRYPSSAPPLWKHNAYVFPHPHQVRPIVFSTGCRDFAQSIVATGREPLLVLDERLHVTFANRAFCETFDVSPETVQGKFVYDLGNGQWDIPLLRVLLEEIVPQNTTVTDFRSHTSFRVSARVA